jgi:hypothetical protein
MLLVFAINFENVMRRQMRQPRRDIQRQVSPLCCAQGLGNQLKVVFVPVVSR